MSVPRGGNDKIGYTEEDGAEFTSKADYTMSWSSFEYADRRVGQRHLEDRAGHHLRRPGDHPSHRPGPEEAAGRTARTVAVKVPYSKDGYRFSVEFDPQLVTAYNDLSGGSGTLTTEEAGNRAIHTEPQNSMLIFANPKPSATQAKQLIPTAKLRAPSTGPRPVW